MPATSQQETQPSGDDQAEEARSETASTGGDPELRGWKKTAFLCLAVLFFTLGVAGAVLPGLPATPFLLLTSYFLVRSSPKLNRRLLRSRWFGPILTDWQVRGGVRWHVKIRAIIFVVAAVGVTLFFTANSLPISSVVVAAACIGILVILRLPAAR